MILTFLLSPLGRKIGLAALVLGGLFFITRMLTNHAYEQGKADGTRDTWADSEKLHKEEWAKADQLLTAQSNALAANTAALKKERAAAAKKAQALSKEFDTQQIQIEQQRKDNEDRIDAIPNTDLVPKLRELLDDLRPGRACTSAKPCPKPVEPPRVGLPGTPGDI